MPSLPPHVQVVAQNIQLLRKSKEDAQVDAALWDKARHYAFSETILECEDDKDDADNNDDVIGSPEIMADSISLDTLCTAFSIIKHKWVLSNCQDAEGISSLAEPWLAHGVPEPNLVFGNVPAALDDHHTLSTSPDFYTVLPHMLQQWQDRLVAAKPNK